MSMTSPSSSIMETYRKLSSQRTRWESWWDELRRFVLPSRLSEESEVPESNSQLYDTTAVEACQKLASGHMSYICPSNELWFKWESPDPNAGDEVQSWYAQCSEIANRELALSNFYTELHECFLDRVGLGTGSLFCGNSRRGRLHFRHIPCGEFLCAPNDEGELEVYIREFRLTPAQALSQFGEKALGEKARERLRHNRHSRESSLSFLHLVQPRAQRNRKRDDAKNMPYQSLYYCIDDEKIVEEGGYREFPYMVTRFLKWGDGPYGLAPAKLVYSDIKQTQFLNRILDMLGEVAAFPRILELANQVGEVDLRAGGRTLINAESASLGYPREWATQGRYDVGMDRLKQKQDSINRAFFVPMLELWSENKQRMTAAEVYARENERVMLFSPSFTLFATDCQPLMERVFATLLRLGKFSKPPAAALQDDGRGNASISEPHVVYQGRIAQVMRRLQSEGLERALIRLQAMSSVSPNLADHLDLEKSFRLAARMDGMPETLIRPEHKVKRMRSEREGDNAQQMQQLAGMQNMAEPSAALAGLGLAPQMPPAAPANPLP